MRQVLKFSFISYSFQFGVYWLPLRGFEGMARSKRGKGGSDGGSMKRVQTHASSSSQEGSTVSVDLRRWAFNSEHVDEAADVAMRLAPHLCPSNTSSTANTDEHGAGPSQRSLQSNTSATTGATASSGASVSPRHAATHPIAPNSTAATTSGSATEHACKQQAASSTSTNSPVQRSKSARVTPKDRKIRVHGPPSSAALTSAACANAPSDAPDASDDVLDTDTRAPSSVHDASVALSTLCLSRGRLQRAGDASSNNSSSSGHGHGGTASNAASLQVQAGISSSKAHASKPEQLKTSGRSRQRAHAQAFVPSPWVEKDIVNKKASSSDSPVIGTALSSESNSTQRKAARAQTSTAAAMAMERPNGVGNTIRPDTPGVSERVRAEEEEEEEE